MNALEKHTNKVSKLVEWLRETGTEEALDACREYKRTVRNSRIDRNDKIRLRLALDVAIDRHNNIGKPSLECVHGDALVSRRSEARLTLIIGGAA